jgi:hypothetical protein
MFVALKTFDVLFCARLTIYDNRPCIRCNASWQSDKPLVRFLQSMTTFHVCAPWVLFGLLGHESNITHVGVTPWTDDLWMWDCWLQTCNAFAMTGGSVLSVQVVLTSSGLILCFSVVQVRVKLGLTCKLSWIYDWHCIIVLAIKIEVHKCLKDIQRLYWLETSSRSLSCRFEYSVEVLFWGLYRTKKASGEMYGFTRVQRLPEIVLRGAPYDGKIC